MTFPDRITILHVSDFHYSARKLRDQKMVVDALLADIKTQCVGRRRPDIILFSGDLTNGPPVDTHDAAYDLLLDPILKLTNTTNERLFIVPGNHDVEQAAVSDFKAEHVEWQAHSNELSVINDAFDKRKFSAAHDAKFANFLKLQNAISGDRAVYTNPFCSIYHIDALNTDIVVLNSCFSVRRCLRALPASVFSQLASLSANGSSLLGRSGTVNVGSIVPALKYFAIVLRDSPVRRLISRIDSFSRSAIRRMMFKSPMWITPLPPSLTALGEGSHGSILNGNYAPNRLSSARKPTPVGIPDPLARRR